MATEYESLHAKQVYDTVCTTLDEMSWVYDRDDENLAITFGVNGEDIPMKFLILTDVDRQIIRLISFLPFTVPENKLVEMSIATCVVNYRLAVGSFDFDINKGNLLFRVVSSFRTSLISTELIRHLINLSCATVDEYNDQLHAISEGNMAIGDFMNKYDN